MSGTRPTGDEPWTPVKIRETSVTERAVFKRCRRQWFLSVVHRLEGPGINENFWLGELVHSALQAYYEHDLETCGCERHAKCAHARRAALDEYARAANAAVAAEEASAGFLWPHVADEWEKLDDLGYQMVRGYLVFDRQRGGLGEVESVEQRFRVPIPGTKGVLSLRIDLVTRRLGRTGKVRRTVVDHKTASSKPAEAFHDKDDQFTAYHWGYAQATGLAVERVLRNVLLKRPMTEPKLVKGGKRLSTDRRQAVTLESYLDAIREHGFKKADYSEYLDHLAAQGWSAFFVEQETFRTKGQMAEFERNLAHEWRDMEAVAADPELAYPNPTPFNCPSCPVRTICDAMMDQRNEAGLIRSEYVVAPPRK